MEIKTIYEDNDVLVIDKPAGLVVFPEGEAQENQEETLIDILIEQYPELKKVGDQPRYGVVHRLDKDTSGVLLVAKNEQALIFLQKQFKNREVEKEYAALVTGRIKEDSGRIKTLVGRSKGDPRKQVTIDPGKRAPDAREAITEFKVLERYKNYTLCQVKILTGRRHQIRCHLSYIHHPIAGDKLYGFKDSPCPEGLERQFLHAKYLKIKLPNGETKEFQSNLPEELEKIIDKLARQ
jgi:23S rRNA pseudouridine1911/1915/1917 synthase